MDRLLALFGLQRMPKPPKVTVGNYNVHVRRCTIRLWSQLVSAAALERHLEKFNA